jgi:hypothetical protein
MPYNSVAYVREAGGPGELQQHVTDIQGSGLTTVILAMLHIGDPEMLHPADPKKDTKTMELGDLIYNDYPANLIVRGGKFNPKNHNPDSNSAIAKWPEQIARLKQQGSVSSVFMTIGSPPDYWPDFGTIEKMFKEGKADLLKQNIVALKEAFTIGGRCAIDGFDIDCEETYTVDKKTIVEFCEMVFDLGFKVTFCPYDNMTWWQDCMKALWNGRDGCDRDKLSWWNLQCYSGGSTNRNNLQPWIDALSEVVGPDGGAAYLVPGLAPAGEDDVGGDVHCPSGFKTIAAGWNNPKLGGMFLWRYDPLALAKNQGLCDGQNNLKNYVKAINEGLSKK